MNRISGRVVKRIWTDADGRTRTSPTWYFKGRLNGREVFKSLDVPIEPNERQSRKEAVSAAETYKTDIRRGNLGWLLENRTTFGTLADFYYTEHVLHECRPKSHRKERITIDRLIAFFGKMKLDQIAEMTVRRWRKSGGSASTLNRDLAIMKAILNFGVARQKLSRNPIASVPPIPTQYDPKDPRKIIVNGGDGRRDIIVDAPDATAIFRELSERDRDLLLFTYLGAFRRDEPLALLWEDIETENGQRMILLRGGATKTGKDRRVPITPRMEEILNRLPHRKGFIFSQDGSAPTTGKAWSERFKKARKRAEKLPDYFRYTVQDLRRSRATRLADAGVPLRQIQLLLGHASLEMTEHYLNRTEKTLDSLIAVARTLDGYKGGSNPGTVANSLSLRVASK